VDYTDGIRAPAVGTYTIKAGAARTFDQSTEGHAGGLVMAGTIGSDVPIASTAMQESSKVILAYSGFTGGYNNPAMPLINSNNSGWQTGVQIYNSGGSPSQVRVDYYPTWSGTAYIGTACHETRTIASNSSMTFALYVFGPPVAPLPDDENCIQGETFVGTAKVTSNGASMPLTAIVNQTNPTSKAGAYASFNPLVSTTKVVFPLIMDRNGVWLTGFNIMNVGTLNTNVSCVFTPPGALGSIGPILLQPNASLNHIQLNKLGVNYVGSATCTSAGIGADPAQPIIGVVNEVTSPLVNGKDQFMVYEGANISP
jgi:hypothetical protein